MQTIKGFVKSLWANDYVRRVFHTYWQSFIATWALTNFDLDKVALVAAGAAGLSAVKALVLAKKEQE